MDIQLEFYQKKKHFEHGKGFSTILSNASQG